MKAHNRPNYKHGDKIILVGLPLFTDNVNDYWSSTWRHMVGKEFTFIDYPYSAHGEGWYYAKTSPQLATYVDVRYTELAGVNKLRYLKDKVNANKLLNL